MSFIPTTLINGRSDLSLSPQDRGLAYGHGVFETITLNGITPVAWQQHLQRLQRGAQRLNIPLPEGFDDLLNQDLQALLTQANMPSDGRAVLKVMVTRGAGGRGYAVAGDIEITRILSITPFPSYPGTPSETGIKTRLCHTQLARSEHLAGIKHLNRLEQVLARAEWSDPDIREGLVTDTEGHVIEGTMSNVFWIKGDTLYTPDLQFSGVAGIVRERIIKCAPELGLKLSIVNSTVASLEQADELFVCNSVIAVWPVVRCQISAEKSYQWSVGPITQRIQKRLAAEGIY